MPTKRPSSKNNAAKKKSSAAPANKTTAQISAAFESMRTATRPATLANSKRAKPAAPAKKPISKASSEKPIPISKAFAIVKKRKNAGELRNPDKPPELEFALNHLENIRLFRKEGFSYRTILQTLADAGADVSELDPKKMSEAVMQATSTVKRRAQREAERQKRLAATKK